MASITINADRVLIVDSDNPNQVGYTAEKMGSNQSISSALKALVHFSIPAEYDHRRVIAYRLGLYFESYSLPGTSYFGFANFDWLTDAFDATVTFNTMPDTAGLSDTVRLGYSFAGYYYSDFVNVGSSSAQNFLDYIGNGISAWGDRNFWTSTSQNQPALQMSLSDEDYLPTVSGSPNGGYLPKQAENSFTWATVLPEYTLKGWEITGQAFEWKNVDNENWTHIDVADSSYTIPANTITGSSIVWRAVVTVTDGTRTETVYSPEYTISTAEPLGTAIPSLPINSIVDGSRPIRLMWNYSNPSGRLQNGADIQWGPPNSTYQDLASVSGNTRIYTVPADFFPAGTIYWRVRSYNQDGVAGSWSNGVTFTNIAASPAPVLTSNSAPYTTFNWQSEGQEAWQLTVNGVDYGVRYGYDRSFTLPEPLADGQYTASMVIQNQYGLWSQPGTLIFDVQNAPAGTVTITGTFGVDAELRWAVSAGDPQPEGFQVFRDGVQIGYTKGTQFTDRMSMGEHSWHVVAMLPNGNYTRSNTVTGTVSIEEPVIGALTGSGEWIKLALSDRSATVQEFSSERTVTYRHFAGAEYPVLEMAPFRDKTGRYDVSFADSAQAAAFESLFGQVVILKSRRGNVIVGPLATLSKRETDFYTAFTFTIQQIHWEEISDDS